MKTNSLKSLFGLVAVATTLSGTVVAQDKPRQPDRPEEKRRAAASDLPHRSMIDQAIDRAMAEMKDGNRPAGDTAKDVAQWQIGVLVGGVEPILRTHLNLPEGAGVLVSKVIDGSPAAKAGIVENDIIVSAGDRKIDGIETLKDIVRQAGKSDGPLVLAVIHEGKPRMVKILKMVPPPSVQNVRPEGPDQRPSAEMGAMMQQQNRRFEEVRGAMKEMRQQLEQQQRQIKELEKLLGDRKVQDGDPRRKMNRPAEDREASRPEASE